MERRWVVSPDYRSAINAIIQARHDRGISQRELARRLGKPPSFTNKTENLERRLDILEFVAIADALGVLPSALIDAVRAALPDKIEL